MSSSYNNFDMEQKRNTMFTKIFNCINDIESSILFNDSMTVSSLLQNISQLKTILSFVSKNEDITIKYVNADHKRLVSSVIGDDDEFFLENETLIVDSVKSKDLVPNIVELIKLLELKHRLKTFSLLDSNEFCDIIEMLPRKCDHLLISKKFEEFIVEKFKLSDKYNINVHIKRDIIKTIIAMVNKSPLYNFLYNTKSTCSDLNKSLQIFFYKGQGCVKSTTI
ncbi:25.8 kDa protein [Cordyline virus 4]|uniref:25.8 kDa protein n=1 Tax=Cordyline virus 4 TaxID=1177753 RepID=M1NRB7_9CLOS|nr:25.8 kDa protein [Cordyline virus 4]AGF73893.1 25.8 kDa protein [Cordyline virus 4]